MLPLAPETPDDGAVSGRATALALSGAADELDDTITEFLQESDENLDQLDRDLLTLERDPADREALASIFRTLHTLKGTCGFFGFSQLETLAHAAESLLSRLRAGDIDLSREVSATLLATVDAVREILARIEAQRDEGDNDYSLLLAALARLNGGADSTEAAPGAREADETEPARFGDILVQTGRVQPDQLAEALQAQQRGDSRFLGEILVEAGALHPADVADTLVLQEEFRFSSIWDNTVRVDIHLLDKLLDLVEELALTRQQLMQLALAQEDPALLASTGRLNRITTELQEGLKRTRLQPIGSIWSKLPRLVRDLAVSGRKQIRLEMEGQEIVLDRTLIEAIKGPLLHLVRNAVDHGLEPPEVRARAGKPPEGRLLLRAWRENEQVGIELSDDGAGIDRARVREKAVRRGLIHPGQAAAMTDQQLLDLISLPGFSTAERVTSVSGRGVGMDVVKINIEKIGGSVEIESRPGEGTTVRIRLPRSRSPAPAPPSRPTAEPYINAPMRGMNSGFSAS